MNSEAKIELLEQKLAVLSSRIDLLEQRLQSVPSHQQAPYQQPAPHHYPPSHHSHHGHDIYHHKKKKGGVAGMLGDIFD
jgi:Zn-finger nucleic acid-binding protein